MIGNFVRKITYAGVAAVLAGCSSVSPPPSSLAGNSSQMAIDNYHIGVDDIVRVSVWQNEEMSVTVPVRPDGKISMPLLGDVQAGGRTPSQVSASIQQGLSRYLRDPRVVVILQELNSHQYLSRVRVTGAVNNPITLPYRQGMTVIDAVLEAGGVTEFASPNSSYLYRRDGNKTTSLRIRLNDILTRGELDTNYQLGPGDVIAIPERTL